MILGLNIARVCGRALKPRKGMACLTLAGFLIQSCSLGNLAYARTIPPIVLPVRTVTVKKQMVSCTSDEADGFFQWLSALFGQSGGSPALVGSPTFSSGNLQDTVWGLGWFSENDQNIVIGPNDSLIWTDGAGNAYTFLKVGTDETTQLPVYSNSLVLEVIQKPS